MAEARERQLLVIGGAGYIGSVLVRRMLDRGYRVRVLDALLYDNLAAVADLAGHPKFNFLRGDFCDPNILPAALSGITDVVMLAALVGDPICKKYPDQARRINDVGTINLIDTLHGRGLGRFVFMSTCSNYGLRATDSEATEKSELNPQSLYAETKVRVEQYLLAESARLDYGATLLRGATAYGLSPRMRFDLTVNEFTREVAVGNELLVYDADTWRPYCHVIDIATAITKVLEAPAGRVAGEVFNVGSAGENYTKRMLVDLLLRHRPDARIRFREGRVDPRNYRVGFEKIATRLEFTTTASVPGFVVELMAAVDGGRFRDIERDRSCYGNYSLDV